MNDENRVFENLGREVLLKEARDNPVYSQTVSVRLDTEELAKIDALSELLDTTRQEVFSNILFGSLDNAIRGAHRGLQIDLDEYGHSQTFEEVYQKKLEKLNSKLSK
jgi:hypothetical protein